MSKVRCVLKRRKRNHSYSFFDTWVKGSHICLPSLLSCCVTPSAYRVIPGNTEISYTPMVLIISIARFETLQIRGNTFYSLHFVPSFAFWDLKWGLFYSKIQGNRYKIYRAITKFEISQWYHSCLDILALSFSSSFSPTSKTVYRLASSAKSAVELHLKLGGIFSALGWQHWARALHNNGRRVSQCRAAESGVHVVVSLGVSRAVRGSSVCVCARARLYSRGVLQEGRSCGTCSERRKRNAECDRKWVGCWSCRRRCCRGTCPERRFWWVILAQNLPRKEDQIREQFRTRCWARRRFVEFDPPRCWNDDARRSVLVVAKIPPSP